ncbi:MAG: SPOR domain-containing protein [Deltaproteobacteria bacterium]|nr:SPOR domain-containing protein [Deltaproteobacteria bacterium]
MKLENEPQVHRVARRRAKSSLWGGKETNGGALVLCGAVLLALVAFVSGVRIGAVLSDVSPEGRSASSPARPGSSRTESGPRVLPPPDSPEAARENGRTLMSSPGQSPVEEKKIPAEGGTSGAPQARYTLQVAAYNNSAEAQEMVEKLRSRGYPAYQVTGSGAARGLIHRVRVGRFPSLQEARQFALAFEKKEKIKAIISNLPSS